MGDQGTTFITQSQQLAIDLEDELYQTIIRFQRDHAEQFEDMEHRDRVEFDGVIRDSALIGGALNEIWNTILSFELRKG